MSYRIEGDPLLKQTVPEIATDPILALLNEYRSDPRPDAEKINAAVGVYIAPNGVRWVPEAIQKAAEGYRVNNTGYLGPSGKLEWLGEPLFLEQTKQALFGEEVPNTRIIAAGTIGGTNAVSMIVGALTTTRPDAHLLIGTPTWQNHIQIFDFWDLPYTAYTHVCGNAYDFETHVAAIENSPEDAVVFFQAGQTQNPTGANPRTREQWEILAGVMGRRSAIIDAPYAGFTNGFEDDLEAVQVFVREGISVGVAVSYAKNTGLYNERPAALFITTNSEQDQRNGQKVVTDIARKLFSSPAAFGERVVAKCLANEALRCQWTEELAVAAADIKERRVQLAAALGSGFEFLAEQAGLFSLLPLQREQVLHLKRLGVYIVPSGNFGRINVGGIIPDRIDDFAAAVKQVL